MKKTLTATACMLVLIAVSFPALANFPIQLQLPSTAILAIVLVAAALSSIVGFAFAPMASVGLGFVTDNAIAAVEIILICSITIQAYAVCSLRNSIVWRRVFPFFLGGVVGIPVGVEVLLRASGAIWCVAIGTLLVAYTGYRLFGPVRTMQSPRRHWDGAVGVLGGITGGPAGFPGAPVTVWCGLRCWSKEEQRAVYQPYILAMQLVTLAWLGSRSPVTASYETLYYAPVALVGGIVGLRLFRQLTTPQFNLAVNAMLMICGLVLTVRGMF